MPGFGRRDRHEKALQWQEPPDDFCRVADGSRAGFELRFRARGMRRDADTEKARRKAL